MGEPITPFNSGTQLADWESSNCDNCKFKDFDASIDEAPCQWDAWITAAYMGNGTVSEECAAAIGINEKTARLYNWPCRAFRSTKDGLEHGHYLKPAQVEKFGWVGPVDEPHKVTAAELEALTAFTLRDL